MDAFTNFLADNYVWFLIISLILIFALIGYLVDIKEMKSGKRTRKRKEEIKIVDFSNIDQNKSLNQSIQQENDNLNLDEYAKKNEEKKNLNESDSMELENQELGTINMDDFNEIPDLDEGNDKKIENEFK